MRHFIRIQLKKNELTEQEITQMWELYEPYYHYDRESFYSRIASNTHYAFYRQHGKLVGFTGLRIQEIKMKRQYLTMYFGQSVIAKEVRAQGLINRTALLLLRRYFRKIISHQVIFWADALTYRPYLAFAKNLKNFYPGRGQAPDPAIQALRNKIGCSNYGASYNPVTGLVQKMKYLVADKSLYIDSEMCQDPDIRFFVNANPDYASGSGLLTLAPVNWVNICSMLKKALQKYRMLRQKARATPMGRPTLNPA